MTMDRRTVLKGLALGLGAVAGPWSLAGRVAHAATADTPALEFLTPSEHRYLSKMSREIIPDPPVLSGTVDVAANLDRFFARHNYSPDFLVMLRFLRLIRISDAVSPVLKRLAPLTGEDILSFKRTICFLGYYSELNGEADLPEDQRIVWPRIGYGGPKPDDWFPPGEEPLLDQSLLVDRVREEGS